MVMKVEPVVQKQGGKLPRPGSFTSLVRKMFESMCNLEKKPEAYPIVSKEHISVGHEIYKSRNGEIVAEMEKKCPYSAVRECPVPYVFQMPMHYPRYTKQDYETMPEWMLNRLLEEYGLPVTGTIDEKRENCIGSFLWRES